jgi:hypothetical protein
VTAARVSFVAVLLFECVVASSVSEAPTQAPTAAPYDSWVEFQRFFASPVGSSIGLIASVVIGVPLFLWQATGGCRLKYVPTLGKGESFHFFLMFCAKEAEDTMLALHNVLTYQVGAKSRFPANMAAMTDEELEASVINSGSVLMLLTTSVFEDPTVIRTLKVAFRTQTPIIFMKETERFEFRFTSKEDADAENEHLGPEDHLVEHHTISSDLSDDDRTTLLLLLKNVEAISFRKRGAEMRTMITLLMWAYRNRAQNVQRVDSGVNYKIQKKQDKKKLKEQEKRDRKAARLHMLEAATP